MRKLLWLVFLGCLAYVAFTVDIGERTLSEHVSRIWKSEEAQELVTDVKEASGPLKTKVQRGVKAGWKGFKGETSDPPNGEPPPKQQEQPEADG